MIEQLGGRKFLFCMTVVVLASILTGLSAIDGAIYAAIVVPIGGAYITGNVVQKRILGDPHGHGTHFEGNQNRPLDTPSSDEHPGSMADAAGNRVARKSV